MSNKSVIKVIA